MPSIRRRVAFEPRATLSLAFAVILMLAGCAPRGPEVTARAPIRLGSYEWPGCYWIDVAWQKGWFAAAGLNVERVDTDLRYFESLDAVASGKLDAMGFSQFDLVRYVAQGHDLVGVAAMDYSEGAEALVARPGIEQLHDLQGKRIALRRGTYLEYLLATIAQREGLDLSQVTLLDRSGPAALDDFKAGRVDAILVWEPYVTQARAETGGVSLFSTAEFPGLTYNVLAMRRDFVKSHPKDIETLLAVWQRSVKWIHLHPDEASEIVAKLVGEPKQSVRDTMRTDRMLDLADNSRAFSYAAGFESLHGSWRRMNDFMLERGLVADRVDSPDHLDSRFVRALE